MEMARTSESTTTEAAEPEEARVARRLGGRTIVMVGMMGAGKSSLGRRLAARLGLAFVDADTEIEQAATPPSISSRPTARPISATASAASSSQLLDGSPKVLATGGGALRQPETRAAIRAAGVSIWLKVDRDLILHRVKRRPTGRSQDRRSWAVIDRLLRNGTRSMPRPTSMWSRDVAHDVVIGDILAALDGWLSRHAVETV
jgi:shikimate kinase